MGFEWWPREQPSLLGTDPFGHRYLGPTHPPLISALQPFEAQAFATYTAGSTLFVDVWDADALMHVGTLALPLRMLMRQQKGVVKTAMVRT